MNPYWSILLTIALFLAPIGFFWWLATRPHDPAAVRPPEDDEYYPGGGE